MPIKELTKKQIKILLTAFENPTHRLLIRVGLQTGLRSDELRSFPESYVFNPDSRRDVGNKINVHCKSADMNLKGRKSRTIHMPRLLMGDLWDHSIRVRPSFQRRASRPSSQLFLTQNGGAYSHSAISSIFNSIGTRVGFHVTPH